MNNIKLTLTAIVILKIGLIQAQYTAIPDPNFEAFLIEEGFDNEIDGQVLTASISDNTTLMINESAPFFPIEDLTGIQDFASLELLIINVTNCVNIDFGNLENLIDLDLFMNGNLEDIDISGCINLEELSVSDSQLNSLDISQNLSLTEIAASNNSITSVDLSLHPNLTFFSMANNNLTEIDMRNGANENIEFFQSFGNPNLTCIFVDDAGFSTANWTNIDPTTTFVETEAECDALSTEDFTGIDFSIYPNPASHFTNIQSNQQIKQVDIIDLSGKTIKTYKQNSNSYSVTDLSKGLYILNIQTDLGKSSQKLIIN